MARQQQSRGVGCYQCARQQHQMTQQERSFKELCGSGWIFGVFLREIVEWILRLTVKTHLEVETRIVGIEELADVGNELPFSYMISLVDIIELIVCIDGYQFFIMLYHDHVAVSPYLIIAIDHHAIIDRNDWLAQFGQDADAVAVGLIFDRAWIDLAVVNWPDKLTQRVHG